MALRDQPYIPLYVQDFLTDEKLALCSAKATGVYIRLICLMHKSEQYGTILLKQKFKQGSDNVKNFSSQLVKHLPYDFHTVTESLAELLDENVLTMEGDILIQKRMVRDNQLSETRSLAGRKGGLKSFAQANAQAKIQANTEYENENEIKVFSIEKCAEIALSDQRFMKANKIRDGELAEFNQHLERQGKYKMNPLEYKTYFSNWKPKKPELPKKSNLAAAVEALKNAG